MLFLSIQNQIKGMEKKYQASEVENKWYKYWLDNNIFDSTPDDRPPYTVVMPPPNVTGILHMGHMLNGTIQDVLVRYARMNGKNPCWVPGTDHASIATEAKVVNKLKEKGLTKYDIGREKFLEEAWDWTRYHGGVIFEQIKKIGASCDWKRAKFTLDDDSYKSVINWFVTLYEKGCIYRGYKMLNWDPQALTTISDEEVVHKEQNSQLVYINYKIKDETDSFITIATVRAETIFADVAIAVNPNDDRYKKFIGKKVLIPLIEKEIPIIADEYVSIDFGTGCLKITPAHSMDDFDIGERHNLAFINLLNEDGTLNENAGFLKGLDCKSGRKKIISELQEKGFITKIENYQNKIGISERTGATVEPRRMLEWFVDMQKISKPALEVVLEKKINFYPKKFVNTYKHWLENIRDWNISRRLWWGHQIPAYFYGEGEQDFVVANSKEEALEKAKEKSKNSNLSISSLKQDENVLDTWFSSALWPITLFDGVNNPDNNKELDYYYPTTDLITAPDILFFWVARMVIAGLDIKEQIPFKNVYFTGMVRDQQGRKMSKSLGNSPDPLELIDKYSSDGVRMGMLFCSPAGNDLLFDDSLCLQGRNFTNKLWNSFLLLEGWETKDEDSSEAEKIAVDWLDSNINETINQIHSNFKKYKLSESIKLLYNMIWDDYCSFYLEVIKPPLGEKISKQTFEKTIQSFEKILCILHPFLPFITEELWQKLPTKKEVKSISIKQFPKQYTDEHKNKSRVKLAREVITQIRDFRAKNQIHKKTPLKVLYKMNNIDFDVEALLFKLENIETLREYDEKNDNLETYKSFRVDTHLFYIYHKEEEGQIEDELKKLNEEKVYFEGFLKVIYKKLKNENFTSKAPKNVLEIEQKKEKDTLEKLQQIESRIKSLNKK